MSSEAQCGRGWSDRCARATSKKCTCSCGGRNHGKSRDDVPAGDGSANYIVVERECTLNVFVIRDVGPWDRHKTVTNDVERVVRDLWKEGALVSGRRLYYYDSAGRRDEILIRGGRFGGFRAGEMANADDG